MKSKGFIMKLVAAITALTDRSEVLSGLWLRLKLMVYVRRDALAKYMCSQIPSGSVIYDIGAHVGMYSILLARKVPGSQVYSFEPNMDTFERLVKNIRLMNLQDRITPLNIALDESCGSRTFHVSSESGRSSFHEYNATYDESDIVKSYDVACRTVDDLVESGSCKAPDAIKIDTEGHEYQVMCGARNVIMSKSPKIAFEPHAVGSDEISTADTVKGFLSQFDYECISIGYPLWCFKK
jgi:FkbM family methyltransferase